MVMVKAVSGVDVAADGVTVMHYKAGDVFDCPADVAVGLKAEKKVELAGKDAKSEGTGVVVDALRGPGVIRPPAPVGAFHRTELDEEGAKLLAEADEAARMVYVKKPDIEPVEHGGETIDRMMTRGVHGAAVAVEAQSVVATAGKEAARREMAGDDEENEDGSSRKSKSDSKAATAKPAVTKPSATSSWASSSPSAEPSKAK